MQHDAYTPNPETLPAGEAQLWRTSFAMAVLMSHMDGHENRSAEDYASAAADRALTLYRRICERRKAL